MLRLLPIPDLDEEVGDVRRVRALFVGGEERVARGASRECEVVKAILGWSLEERAKLFDSLRLVSSRVDLPLGKNIKFAGRGNAILELRAGKRRLYAFLDHDGVATLVCAGAQSVNRGNKSDRQDEAISRALRLKERWMAATPVPRTEDARVE